MERSSIHSLPENLWQELSVNNTYGTNAIEGSSLTLEDVRTLLIDGVAVGKRPVRDTMEAIQHDLAFKGLLAILNRPIGLVTVLELHEQVFRGILRDAGHWRRVNVFIGGAKIKPPSMEKVVPAMDQWLKDFDQLDKENDDAFVTGGIMHHRFESIHPFSDGNGRVGRLLLNLHMMKHNWPPLNLSPMDRSGYLASLKQADEGTIKPLVGILEEVMSRSLLMILDRVGIDMDSLKSLRDLDEFSSHSAKYLSLRAAQGELPAIKIKGEYCTSRRALTLYQEHVGR